VVLGMVEEKVNVGKWENGRRQQEAGACGREQGGHDSWYAGLLRTTTLMHLFKGEKQTESVEI